MSEEEDSIAEEPFSIGNGVRKIIPAFDPEEEKEREPVLKKLEANYAEDTRDGSHVLLGKDGRPKWGTMPPKVGMLQDERMYRMGPLQCKNFILPDDIESYNSFLQKEGNTGINLDGDPEMMIVGNREEFWRGKYYVNITYREIFYRQTFDTK